MAEPLKIRKSATDTCADILREDILNGRFDAPRSFIIDRVAERLKVSPTPVREAVRKLEAEGLLEYSRGRGVVIRKLRSAEFDELVSLRQLIEPLLIRAACKTADQRVLKVARQQLDKWMVQQGSRPERYQGQQLITDTLYASTGLVRTIEALNSITALIARFHISVWQSSDEVYTRDFDFLTEMINQIEARDPDAAVEAFQQRQTWAQTRVRAKLADPG